MITLLTFPGSFTCPSHSPFCVKAMCLLQLSGEEWEAEYHYDPRKMPYGKLPVARIGGEMVPDSSNIQRALEARGADFFPGLSAPQKAQAHAIQRMAEESLALGLVHERWLNDANWPVVRDTFFAEIPRLLRGPITRKLRKMIRTTHMLGGFARLSDADRERWLDADLGAIEAMLANGPFLFGAAPTAADASVLPVIDMMANLPTDTRLRRRIRQSDVLMRYIKTARAALYPGTEVTALSAFPDRTTANAA